MTESTITRLRRLIKEDIMNIKKGSRCDKCGEEPYVAVRIDEKGKMWLLCEGCYRNNK